MYIISDDSKTILNMDRVSCIFLGSEKKMIMAAVAGAANVPLMPVQTEAEGRTAIQIISERMESGAVVRMPEVCEIKARIALDEVKYHQKQGKKTKSHGGS
jgi:hypothetical protein